MTPEFQAFFTSMIPFLDYKLGIPLGIQMGLPVATATIFGVVGSVIPCIFILLGLHYLSELLRRHFKLFDKFFTNLYHKTQYRHHAKFEKYGSFLLLLSIILPLPGTGPGTATLIAFVFGVKFWHAIGLIAIGTMLSGILIAGGFTSVMALIHIFY